MLARIFSGAVIGVDAYSVEIEVNAGGGDMAVVIVGLPDAAVKESKDRVYTALINSHFFLPDGRTTINLAPANIRKEGPSFDLPIALGVVAAIGKLDKDALHDVLVVGELALSGEVRSVRGVLPLALHAREMGYRGILTPAANAREAAVVEGLKVFPVRNLRESVDFLNHEHHIEPLLGDIDAIMDNSTEYMDDFEDIKGQEYAKRAVEVAVAGGHNCLAIGPPGTGKSMIAKRVPSILPPLSLDEALEVTKIHSVMGALGENQALISRRPFRTPHHTISDAGLLGGGSNPLPGEVSLAHNGVLFLDEMPEFRRNVLEVMRQPLEDGHVTISRASASVTYPCRFMLFAAMNPCPCGYQTDPNRECRCSHVQIQRYRNRISGPLLDRIDIHIEVPAVPYQELTALEKGENSAAVRARVVKARNIQQERFRGVAAVHNNASMRARQVQQACVMNDDAHQMLKTAMDDMNFSARAYERILKVARTIADLAEEERIGAEHISEAIQYRSLDRQLW